MALEAVSERLQAVRTALAGQPLEAVADRKRLRAVQSALKELARELRQAVEEDPAAPLPLSPAQAEDWAHRVYEPQVLGEVYEALASEHVPAPATGSTPQTRPVALEGGTGGEPPGGNSPPSTGGSYGLASFTRDVAKGVAIGLAVGFLLRQFGGGK